MKFILCFVLIRLFFILNICVLGKIVLLFCWKIVEEKYLVVLDCLIDIILFSENVVYSWIKNGVDVILDECVIIIVFGVLFIKFICRIDLGVYMCIV